MKRIFNFSAGPATLPESVLDEASKGVLEFNNSGMSILELSHRGKHYEGMHQETRQLLLKTMNLKPEEYTVLFMGGGASTQFATIPMNFLKPGSTADYVNEGEWGNKAIKEAQKVAGSVATVHVAGSSEGVKFATCAKSFQFTPGAAYAHLTTNNTIEGTQHRSIPDMGGSPIILDASSDFLSHELDYSRCSVVYAGAQKNAGAAGVTIIVLKKSFMAAGRTDLPSIFHYAAHDKSDSLLNTPPAFPIYVFNLMLKWIEKEGGVKAIDARNQHKAKLIYDAIDAFPDVYDAAVTDKGDRSLMNITWRVKNADREKEFLAESEKRGMDGLKGHRNVGGFRASTYNAFPLAGCEALAQLLKDFAKK
jgi:phosphoserine aminotransferase